jgi:cbb3-type cytochrome oxidase subunit 3
VDFGHVRRRQVMAAGATILLGLVLLAVGAIAAQSLLIAGVILSVAGFVVTVGGCWWLFRDGRRSACFTARRPAGDPVPLMCR